jgi:hypothetical protein
MKIRLLRTFSPDSFTYEINEDKEVTATNRKGDLYKENVDYIVEDRDKPGVELIQANGISTFEPPK